MNAIIYTRVSTDEQVKGFSLGTQLKDCREFCESKGWTVVDVFQEEGESGTTDNRPELKRMLAYLQKHRGLIQYVVVWKIDRISRLMKDHFKITELIEECGSVVVSKTESFDKTLSGELQQRILQVFSEYDNKVRAERSVTGTRGGLENGIWMRGIPTGYKGRDAHKVPLVDPIMGPILADILVTFSRGNHEVKQITELAKQRGLLTPKDEEVSDKTMHKILRNPFYYGWLSMQGKKIQYGGYGKHQPLIDKDTFFKIQSAMLSHNNRSNTRHRNREEFPLKKLLRCGVCGGDLTAGSSPNKKKVLYWYYHCQKSEHLRIPKDLIEKQFETMLERIRPTEGILNLFRLAIRNLVNERMGDAITNVQRVDKELTALRDEKNGYVRMRARNELDEALFFQMLREVDAKINKKEMIRAEMREEEVDIDKLLALYESLFKNVAMWWREAPLEYKQQMQHLVYPKGITVMSKLGEIQHPELGLAFAIVDSLRSGSALSSPEGNRTPDLQDENLAS